MDRKKQTPRRLSVGLHWSLRNQENLNPMGRVERDREIARRRSRRVKLKKLRKLYAKADSKGRKDELLAKARRLSPFIELEAAEK
jgi:hypothetical protein